MSLFPKRLKELRVLNKLTQDELGAVLGFTRAAISGYEIGRNQPSIEDLNKLADYFCVSVDYLIGKSNYRIQKESHKNKVTDSIVKKLIEKNIIESETIITDEIIEEISMLLDKTIDIYKIRKQ